MVNRALRIKLFNAIDELNLVKQELADAYEELDDVRGELHKALQVADRRKDMIRDLVAENKALTNKLRSKPPVDAVKIQQETVEHILQVIEKHFKSKEERFIF